ncbi:MAG: hypothetical protein A3A58_03160 [Candidatus Blackburnbacteria bacterium RIFCSPLOWO2_01_FULL_41_27]|uniref:Uncharacterized protein n=2 Tax=Candidatus Blackburniibacteriota TaxID=1817898 RepID=A0A1G1V523_9BACT|nr:MAG: hypothetical protein A3F61_03975 [Candidatus Blackburnbacteria bacterium RIFCSPHIGHO2_12_FULL_41_13b]OGY14527.1 MAG: hypothetical protein A3A58_03160 [Candidatus Blackburnbacteria bacterium RIFCSPLOWO2_01_FULL_41_27]
MSYSLFLTKENKEAITPEELSSATEQINQELPEVRFEPNDTKESYMVYFKENDEDLDKVAVDYVSDSDHKKLIVESNSRFVGYIEFVAYHLADKLDLKVFDPQPPFNKFVELKDLKHTLEEARKFEKEYLEKGKKRMTFKYDLEKAKETEFGYHPDRKVGFDISDKEKVVQAIKQAGQEKFKEWKNEYEYKEVKNEDNKFECEFVFDKDTIHFLWAKTPESTYIEITGTSVPGETTLNYTKWLLGKLQELLSSQK